MADFYPGQTLGRGDLDIFLVDSNGAPLNPATITYAIYWVDPGPPIVEVLIGSATRTPVNPTTGEFYAALMVPPSAVAGTYRIKWTFQQYAASAAQTVVQEWTVVVQDDITTVSYTGGQQQMITKLRMLLRDQCVGGEETVELDVEGEKMVVTMEDLWEVLSDLPPPGQ